jgi:hypothetical protein
MSTTQARRTGGRLGLFVVVFFVVLSITSAKPLVDPPKAEAFPHLPSPCSLVPINPVRKACHRGENSPAGRLLPIPGIGPVPGIPGLPDPTHIVGGAIDKAAQATIGAAINWLADQEAQGMLWVLKQEYTYVNNSNTPKVNQGWFVAGLYALVFGMGFYVSIGALAFEMGSAVQEKNPRRFGDAMIKLVVFWGVGLSLPALVAGLVWALDTAIAPLWMQYAGANTANTLNHMHVNFNKELTPTNNPIIPIIMPFIFGIVGLLGGVAMEFLLVVRDSVLFLLTAAEIIVLGLWVSERLSGNALQRTSLMLGAWCGFKVYAAFALVVGLLLLGSQSGFSAILVGAVICFLAPYIAWRTVKAIAGHQMSIRASFTDSASLYGSVKGMLS